MNKPYISVIITAYNRKEFVAEAVNSVLNQSLAKQKYEIILIKNFKTEYDKSWKEKGVKLILKEGSMGEYLYTGILLSKGEIITFLEDDDLYEQGRLESVYRAFKSQRNLLYYRNNMIAFSESGPVKFIGSVAKDQLVYSSEIKKLYPIVLLGAWGNPSCMAIKRSAIIDSINLIRHIQYGPDGSIFYAALHKNAKLFLTTKALTRYRIHNNNTSIGLTADGIIERAKRYFKDGKYDFKIFKQILIRNNNKNAIKILNSQELRSELNDKIILNKKVTIKELLKYVYYYSIPYTFYCKKIDYFLLLLLIYNFFPKFSRNLLIRRMLLIKRMIPKSR
ncbi:MAG: glycosyltransferase family 2 protein [Candidatus Micrarchaeaceae archaeon]